MQSVRRTSIEEPIDVPAKPTSVGRVRALCARLRNAAARVISNFGKQLVSAVLWFLLMTAAGAGLLVAGVFVLAGLGWALIAGGALCICAASFIRKGMSGE